MRDHDHEALTKYDYERRSAATRDGMFIDRTPIHGVVSIFSENKKEGRWEVPRHMRVVAIFGGAKLDLRDAVMGPGISVIETLTIFGSVEIIVPPEINVECDGDAFLGEFALHRAKRGPASIPAPPGAPVIRVTGDAYLAAVTVRVKVAREEKFAHRVRKLFD
jgi:hypothetical protein